MAPSHKRIPLNSGWTFRQANKPNDQFLPTAQFPTVIHIDLQHHGIIKDPLLDTNFTEMQWVGEEEWLYRTTFHAPAKESHTKFELVFEGLDTHATISMNGKEIQKTENMYIEYRVDVSDHLQPDSDNALEILFHSTFLIGKQLEKDAEQKPLFWHNGDRSRLQVRKAPYSYGWDFMPPFLTCGPWRPVYLDVYTAKITDFDVSADVTADLASAKVSVTAEIGGTGATGMKVQILDPQGKSVQEKDVTFDHVGPTTIAKVVLEVKSPDLWWPNGNGGQPLYTITAAVSSADKTTLASTFKRIGFRRIRLVQRPLKAAPGTTFFVEVNNVPIYSRGANWVPTDTFLPRITPKRYQAWIELAAKGNMNMIRVWGGGIYEDQVFYDLCDELGIMIWQDFMLACGSYPVTPKFLKDLEYETIHNIKRLRSHACMALWCGNNEDHMFADWYLKDEYNYNDHDPQSWLKSKWPARIIYDKILPELVQKHSPEIPYHPGSPWGGKPAMDPTVGDVHAWGVWMKASEQYPYQWYHKLAGRFSSEFGLKAYPPVRTIKEFVTDPREWHPQSRTLDHHLKASSKSPWAKDYRTVALYIQENFRIGRSLEKWVYGSQLSQAEAMHFAFSGWRRLWKGPGYEECAGTLVWVMNDAFPSVSWSLADYKVRPKYVYYSIKRELAPIVVSADRVEVVQRPNDFTEAYVVRETHLQVWASNFTPMAEEYELVIQKIDLASGRILEEEKQDVTLLENRSTELVDEVIDEVASRNVLFYVRLLRDGKTMSRYLDWAQFLKYLELPRPDVKVQVEGDNIVISAPLPVKGFVVDIDDDEVEFSDNCIDLVPGEEQVIYAKGLNGRIPQTMHLATAAD